MKIACISTSRVPSSTANSIQLMKVCNALAENGHSVRLYVPRIEDENSDWETLSEQYGIGTPFEVIWLPVIERLRRYDFALSAVEKSKAWGANLVYTWTIPAAAWAQLRGSATILELHDRVTGRLGTWSFRQFLKLRGNKRILIITMALRKKLFEMFGPDLVHASTQIAPNGVNLDQYAGLPDAPGARKQLGLREALTVTYTGHFYAGRGAELLYRLAEALPNIQFLWVGGRKEDVDYWSARLQAGGIENIVLTGFVENQHLPLYQAAGDVLIMPYERAIAGSSGGNSADICSPMKMFDYLASGRAILTSDLPVFREVLNENNAVFCPPENFDAWRTALSRLSADPSWRERLGKRALADAARFSWKARAQRSLEGFVPSSS